MSSSFRNLRQTMEYGAVRGALSLAGKIPIEAAQRIGAGIGRVAFDVARVRRAVSVDNVERALGVPHTQAVKITRASYENWGRCLMEFSAFAHMTKAELLSLVTVEGLESFDRVRAEGKGGVLVSGHLGNWELIPAVLTALDRPVHGLIGRQSNTRVNDVMNDLRRRQNIPLITKELALKKVLQVLRAGEFVVLLADQNQRKGGVFVDFLGRPASTVRGPALFAIRSGAPIVPTFVAREGTRHRLIVEPAIYPMPAGDEEEVVRDLTQRYTDRLAAHIKARPQEYFWPHRRWKTQPPQPEPSQPVPLVT